MNERTLPPTGGMSAASTEPRPQAGAVPTLAVEQRLQWLAAFAAALAQVGPEAFVECLTAWLLPAVADMYCLALVQPDGAIETRITAHADAHLHRLLTESRAWCYHDPSGAGVVAEVIRSGRPLFFPTMDHALYLAAARDAPHAELRSALQMHAGAVVPLLVQGQAIGALSIGIMAPERRLDQSDAGFLNEIAQRIALVLDNQQLRRQAQEAGEARDASLAIMAHELRTPIAALITQLQILRRRVDEADRYDERVLVGMKMLDTQVRRLNVLVDTLLEATYFDRQPRPLAHERFDVGQIVRRVHDAFLDTLTSHTLHLDLSREALIIEGDPLRIEQALQNLLQNAVKYSPYGGNITLRLERYGLHAQITISDEGIGIPPEARTRIFERFYRAANAINQGISGVGVGLYVVQAIIALHNGTIVVAETPAAGASFVVELPLAPA